MGPQWPQRITIVGLGLIGGSLGLALREHRPDVRVVGVDCDERALDRAVHRGAVHEAHRSLRDGVADAELVVLAAPVSIVLEHLDRLPALVEGNAIVTDVGSTKRTICRRGHECLSGRFVGGHPLVGAERTGIDAARADLFRRGHWVLTPENGHKAPAHLRTLWDALGANVISMTPERHDRIVAATSHLPQLLSVALGARLADGADADEAYRSLIASGGADWLRLTRSAPEIWRDIAATNADRLHDEIQALIAHLQALDGDLHRLDEAFERARRLEIPNGNPVP